jgi:hypothetical protein
MEATLTQPCRVQEDGPLDCKLLLNGKNGMLASVIDGTIRISHG